MKCLRVVLCTVCCICHARNKLSRLPEASNFAKHPRVWNVVRGIASSCRYRMLTFEPGGGSRYNYALQANALFR